MNEATVISRKFVYNGECAKAILWDIVIAVLVIMLTWNRYANIILLRLTPLNEFSTLKDNGANKVGQAITPTSPTIVTVFDGASLLTPHRFYW